MMPWDSVDNWALIENKYEFGWVQRERYHVPGTRYQVPGTGYQVPGEGERYLWWSSSRAPGRDAVNASFT